MSDRLHQWLASFVGALCCAGLLQLAAPWLGFRLRMGWPLILLTAILGLPGVLLILALHLLLFGL